jgi:hypothetical protein
MPRRPIRTLAFIRSAGSASRLGYLGHIMTENRNGLVIDTALTLATGTAERDARSRAPVVAFCRV